MEHISSLPIFTEARTLSLTDKPMLDSLLATLQPRMSELTFASLYLFRNAHAYRLCRINDVVVVLGQGGDGQSYALSPLTTDPVAVSAALLAAGITIYAECSMAITSGNVQVAGQGVADRDSFDYLYLREELATLLGNRFHKKKNRVNYFARRHAYQVQLLGPDLLHGCQALLQEWQRVRQGTASKSLGQEVLACTEALQLQAQLGLQGVVVTVAGRVVAFAIGERLNRETAVCHFEKADPFLDGAGQLVNREFCRMLFSDCRYINREQDLGEPGLREAKLSYHPVALIEKCRVSPKGAEICQ